MSMPNTKHRFQTTNTTAASTGYVEPNGGPGGEKPSGGPGGGPSGGTGEGASGGTGGGPGLPM